MDKYFPDLLPGNTYHIYTHAPNRESLFRNDNNYVYFLERYKFHINRVCHTSAWCLMPNHVHFLVNVKTAAEIISDAKELSEMPYREDRQRKLIFKIESAGKEQNEMELNTALNKWVSKCFGNLFSSYTQAYNKQQNRSGILFRSKFNRKEVKSDSYFRNLVHYIHYNPVKHRFAKSPEEWKYSSYNSLISEKPTLLNREFVLDAFGGRDAFIDIHRTPPDLTIYFE